MTEEFAVDFGRFFALRKSDQSLMCSIYINTMGRSAVVSWAFEIIQLVSVVFYVVRDVFF